MKLEGISYQRINILQGFHNKTMKYSLYSRIQPLAYKERFCQAMQEWLHDLV